MTHSILAAIALTLVASTASAQHNPYSYASQYLNHSFPGCEDEAERTLCLDATGTELDGLECAREMQSIYSDCVARDVCEQWYEGIIETGVELGDEAYLACLSLVVATGGEY